MFDALAFSIARRKRCWSQVASTLARCHRDFTAQSGEYLPALGVEGTFFALDR
jgi:hypothetical protein